MVHIEFMLNDDGVYFIEIGKRPAGAWVPRMYHHCYGINILNYHLESLYLQDDQFSQPALKYKYGAGLFLLLPNSGVLSKIKFPDNLNFGCEFNAITTKIGQHQVKTYSLFDVIAEAVIYSNDKIEFNRIFNCLLNNTEISVV